MLHCYCRHQSNSLSQPSMFLTKVMSKRKMLLFYDAYPLLVPFLIVWDETWTHHRGGQRTYSRSCCRCPFSLLSPLTRQVPLS